MLKESDAKHTATFLAKISHELKSPIHGILGVSEYLLDNWDDVDDNTKKLCLFEMHSTAGSLNFLVLSLLNLHVVDSEEIQYNMSKMSFKERVFDVIDSMKIFLIQKQGLHIETQINVESDEIVADSVWFKQLLSNIFINAIKFSTEGVIVFRAEEANLKGKDYYIFSISDEGSGVPEHEISSIFSPFTKGSRNVADKQGSGLGLSICTEIVKAHGGEINAYNNELNGLTIAFTIPNFNKS